MSTKINILLDSFNKIYKVNDFITGTIEINSNTNLSFEKITSTIKGEYLFKSSKSSNSQVNSREVFYRKTNKISDSSTIKANQPNKFPFKFQLTSSEDNQLIESYSGVVVSIVYDFIVEIENLKVSNSVKIYVISPGQGMNPILKEKVIPYQFTITEKSIEKIKIEGKLPKFRLDGYIDNLNVDIGKELNGWIKLISCEIPVKSIELQFIRNEKATLSRGEVLNEVSEIQNLQIGDGEVLLNNEISLNMVFPRHFCCASIENSMIKVYFDINIILVLENGYVISENIPLNCWRSC